MKIAAKRIVLSHYPKATIERQRGNGYGEKHYFLVRKERHEHMWSGCGDTQAQAWADAQDRLKLTGLKESS